MIHGYERLRCFVLLLVTDDKQVFVRSYNALTEQSVKTKGKQKSGMTAWAMAQENYETSFNEKARARYWKNKEKKNESKNKKNQKRCDSRI